MHATFATTTFRLRHFLASVVVVVPLLISFYLPFGQFISFDKFASVAWMLVFSGIALRLWARAYHMGKKNKELVIDGPYALSRNPMYVGNLLSAVGASLFFGNWVCAALVLIGCSGVYIVSIAHEENNLARIFGDSYRLYCETTPRMIPGIIHVASFIGKSDVDESALNDFQRELYRAAVTIFVVIFILIVT